MENRYISQVVFAFGIKEEEKVDEVRMLLVDGWEVSSTIGGKCVVCLESKDEDEANSVLSEMLEVYKDYEVDGDVVVEKVKGEVVEREKEESGLNCICGGRCCEIY